MATNDRSVGLSDLAARAQSGGGARKTNSCRNPECQNGMTPGLVAAGGGSKAQPLFGVGGIGAKRLMRWGWVPCLACNAPEDARKAGAVYRHLNLTQQQIAQRAQMATTKASHQVQPRETLSRTQSRPAYQTPNGIDSRQLTEMIEQNKKLSERLDEMLKQNAEMTQTLSRMSTQVADLLEDNGKLREQLAKPATTVPGHPAITS